MHFTPVGLLFNISNYKIYFTLIGGEVTVIDERSNEIVRQWRLKTNNKKTREALINLLALMEQGRPKEKIRRKYRGYRQ